MPNEKRTKTQSSETMSKRARNNDENDDELSEESVVSSCAELHEISRLRVEHASSHSLDSIEQPHGRASGVFKFEIAENDVRALAKLNAEIANRVVSGVTWGEGDEENDPRRRMYGFMPGKRQELEASGVRLEAVSLQQDDTEKSGRHSEHAQVMANSSVDLIDSASKDGIDADKMVQLDLEMKKAIETITRKVHNLVTEKYRRFITMDQLVAVQPNLHNGAAHLPLHLDFPRNDGFGVVIVTICISNQDSEIILVDYGDDGEQPKSWSFPLSKGEGYILSGNARNKCLHGVLDKAAAQASSDKEALATTCFRETMNLRYGLHTIELADSEINCHWPE